MDNGDVISPPVFVSMKLNQYHCPVMLWGSYWMPNAMLSATHFIQWFWSPLTTEPLCKSKPTAKDMNELLKASLTPSYLLSHDWTRILMHFFIIQKHHYQKYVANRMKSPQLGLGIHGPKRIGPGPNRRPDRTKTNRILKISDRTRTKKILKISDRFRPVGPGPCGPWIPG